LIDADVSQCVYVNGQSVCVEERCVYFFQEESLCMSVLEKL